MKVEETLMKLKSLIINAFSQVKMVDRGGGGGVLEINIKLGLRVESKEEFEIIKSETGSPACSIL